MLPTTAFSLRSASGVQNVKCSSHVWNGITVRHLTNVARPGKVWHDLSSSEVTVAVLLEQHGGIVETRHKIQQPVGRERYGAGQIDFVPAGTSVWGLADGMRSTRSLRLYFSDARLIDLFEDELDLAKTTKPLLMQYDERVSRCASLLAEECDESSFGNIYGESLTLALTSALFVLQKTGAGGKASLHSLALWQLRRAIEYFEANLNKEITLKDVSAAVGLSQSRFSRAFKGSTGVSPYRWCTEARINKAKELLVRNDSPLALIAEQTGFADQSHLTRTFKRIVGSSPRAWHRAR